MPELSPIATAIAWSAVSKGRRRQILAVLLEHPAGLTFVEILNALPRLREETARRELRRLEVDGHVVVSFEGLWLTSRQCVARFNRGRS